VLIERPRLQKWISLESAELFVTTLTARTKVLPDPAVGPALARDPDDDSVVRPHATSLSAGEADLVQWHEQKPPASPFRRGL
jgi:hypothetical protein